MLNLSNGHNAGNDIFNVLGHSVCVCVCVLGGGGGGSIGAAVKFSLIYDAS